MSGDFTFSATCASAQKAYNCPRCNAIVPLGMRCYCMTNAQGRLAAWAHQEPPHCPTCTCGATEAVSGSAPNERV